MGISNHTNSQRGSLSIGILIISIIAIAFAFSLGMRYERSKIQIVNKPQDVKVAPQVTPQKEDLEERCGKLPSEAYPKGEAGWSDIQGPFWSSDCRYAISSLSIVGRGLGPNVSFKDTQKFVSSLPTGVYLYSDANKTLTKVYKNGTVEEWKDRENLTFNSEGKKYNYNVIDKKVTLNP